MTTELVFMTEPRPKGRPRFSARGKFVRVFTDARTVAYEKLLAGMAKQQYQLAPMAGALAVEIIFAVTRPKSVKRALHTVKSDLDNFIKAALDALNGIVWRDDCQIFQIKAHKKYADSQHKPGVYMEVTEI